MDTSQQDILAIPAETIDADIAELEQEVQRIAIRLEMLRDLRRRAIRLHINGSGEIQQDRSPAEDTRLGPKSAVLDLLAKEPDLKSGQIIERLNGQVRTKGDFRNVIYSTLNTLKKSGDIIQKENGRYRLS